MKEIERKQKRRFRMRPYSLKRNIDKISKAEEDEQLDDTSSESSPESNMSSSEDESLCSSTDTLELDSERSQLRETLSRVERIFDQLNETFLKEPEYAPALKTFDHLLNQIPENKRFQAVLKANGIMMDAAKESLNKQ